LKKRRGGTAKEKGKTDIWEAIPCPVCGGKTNHGHRGETKKRPTEQEVSERGRVTIHEGYESGKRGKLRESTLQFHLTLRGGMTR